MDEEYLTVAEIAEMLKPNQQTVRDTIDRSELPAVRVGPRRVRVLRLIWTRGSPREGASEAIGHSGRFR